MGHETSPGGTDSTEDTAPLVQLHEPDNATLQEANHC